MNPSQTNPDQTREKRARKKQAPSDVAAEYRKLGLRLLMRLAEDGMLAERRADQIVLLRQGSSISLASGMPTGVLAELLHSGAVQCQSRSGRTYFTITEEGRAHIRRERAVDEPFGAQHRTMETREIAGEAGREVIRVNTREDPLDVFRRGRHCANLVGAAELDAADRLRRDLAQAQAVPQVTANWSRLVVDGAGYNPGLSVSEAIIEARRRVDAAMRAVGPDFSGILMDICGFSKGLEALEKENAFPLRSGKVVVGYALRGLARHYGLSNAATGKNHAPMRHWGAEGYRPKLQAG
jgi:hypothetical protein